MTCYSRVTSWCMLFVLLLQCNDVLIWNHSQINKKPQFWQDNISKEIHKVKRTNILSWNVHSNSFIKENLMTLVLNWWDIKRNIFIWLIKLKSIKNFEKKMKRRSFIKQKNNKFVVVNWIKVLLFKINLK